MGKKIVLKVGHLRITDHLILGVSKAKLNKEIEHFQYCDLEPVAMTSWNEIGDSFMNNEIDIAFILAPYAMELFYIDPSIRLFLLGHREGSVIVTNKKLNIKGPKDFIGKTVLIPYHLSVHHMIIHKLLKANNIEAGIGKDMMFEVVAPSQIPEIMSWDESGQIAGFIVAEPFGAQVVTDGIGETLAYSKDIWPHHPCCVLIARDNMIKKHPEAFAELTESFVKSGQLIHQKPESAIKIGSNFLNQNEYVMQKVLSHPGSIVSYDTLMPNLDDLELIQNYLTTEIQAMSSKIDLEKFVDLQFAKAAGAK